VREGRVEQWLEQESRELGAGEAVYIPRDVVHASYTVGDQPARLSVMLSPTAGEGGYEVIDVFTEEPWASLR
jgi:quercetin dioxygenase-like cupin family protein